MKTSMVTARGQAVGDLLGRGVTHLTATRPVAANLGELVATSPAGPGRDVADNCRHKRPFRQSPATWWPGTAFWR